jgi:hypothetical protein
MPFARPMTYRYKRPPRKRKAVPLEVKVFISSMVRPGGPLPPNISG